MTTWITDAVAKPLVALRVLVRAWPAWAAVATAVVAVVAEEVVPRLPGGWPAQVAGYCAAVLTAVAAISAAVARVTPILFPSEKGLLPLPDAPAMEFDPGRVTPRDAEDRYPPLGGD